MQGISRPGTSYGSHELTYGLRCAGKVATSSGDRVSRDLPIDCVRFVRCHIGQSVTHLVKPLFTEIRYPIWGPVQGVFGTFFHYVSSYNMLFGMVGMSGMFGMVLKPMSKTCRGGWQMTLLSAIASQAPLLLICTLCFCRFALSAVSFLRVALGLRFTSCCGVEEGADGKTPRHGRQHGRRTCAEAPATRLVPSRQ